MGQKPPSLAHEKLVELKDRYNAEGHVDDVFLASHRDLIAVAIHATNGCEDKLAALVQLAGMQVLVAAEEKLREPAKLKAFFDSYHGPACPVNALVSKDAQGHPVMPWTREIQSMLAEGVIAGGAKTQRIPVPGEEPAKEEGSGVEYSSPGFGKVRIYGKGALRIAAGAAVVAFLAWRAYQDYSFKRDTKAQLAAVVDGQAYGRTSATAQRSKIREDVQELMDKGDRELLPYEPSDN